MNKIINTQMRFIHQIAKREILIGGLLISRLQNAADIWMKFTVLPSRNLSPYVNYYSGDTLVQWEDRGDSATMTWRSWGASHLFILILFIVFHSFAIFPFIILSCTWIILKLVILLEIIKYFLMTLQFNTGL